VLSREDNEASRLVTLGEPCEEGGFSGALKIGSLLNGISRLNGGGAVGRGDADCPAADGPGTEGEGAALKNWVKLPSADAESEAPGEENPLAREEL
jgi:hypothetical protein